jgi:transcriptional regulator with XRE-family HTH domain
VSRATAVDREFGSRVYRARVIRRLTQEGLARALGDSSQSRIWAIESGLSPATISEAIALAGALGFSLGDPEFATGEAPACPRCDHIREYLRDVGTTA